MPEGESDAAHLTAPQPHAREAQSLWPPLVALGVVALGVGLLVSPPVAALGLLLVIGGIVGATREVRDEALRRTRVDAPPHDVWGKRPKQWWLAAGFALSTTMVFVAILRAFDAHALLDPESWPPVARDLDGPLPLAAMVALAGSAAAAQWGLRRVRRRRSGEAAAFALALLLGAAHLAWRASEWLALLDAGFSPTGSAAAGGYYALTAAHALALLLALAVLGMATWGLDGGRLDDQGEGIRWGAVLYLTWVVLLGAVVYALVYLRVVVYEGRALL